MVIAAVRLAQSEDRKLKILLPAHLEGLHRTLRQFLAIPLLIAPVIVKTLSLPTVHCTS